VSRESEAVSAAGGLTDRQEAVLRAVVASYLSDAAPVGSAAISHVLPTRLSSASIRTTLAELGELGLLEKPHASAGRVPSQGGLRLFIDRLLPAPRVSDLDRRAIDYEVEEAGPGSVAQVASKVLSDRTHLLGFAVAPRVRQLVLQHVSLVRISDGRILAVLVSTQGAAHQRVIDDTAGLDQRQLDRVAGLLNERVVGLTLPEVRASLRREARSQRRQADRLLAAALELGSRALLADEEEGDDLVIATRLALLDQPEYQDPERLRELFEAVETKERLLEVIERMLDDRGVHVALGNEVDEPSLYRCALVAAPYGADAPIGAIGVIGPSRMDYARVMALVDYFSKALTEKLAGE
jgi:heat-inducible transcriptional repressor